MCRCSLGLDGCEVRLCDPRGRAGVSLGLDGCEVRLCDPCARVRPCVPCVSSTCECPGSPRCLFTGIVCAGSAGVAVVG